MSEPKDDTAAAGGTGVAGRPFSEMPGLNAAIAAERAAEDGSRTGAESAEAAAGAGADSGTAGRPYAEMPGLNAAAEAERGAAAAAATATAAKAGTTPAGGQAQAASKSTGARKDATATTPPSAARTQPPKPPAEAARRGGGGGIAVAALVALVAGGIGGMIAVPLVAPILPEPVAAFLDPEDDAPDPQMSALEARLAELEAEVEIERAEPADLAALSERIDALEARETDTGGEAGPGAAQRAAEAEATAAEAAASLAALAERVSALETSEPEVTGAEIATLAERIAELEAAEPEVTQADIDAIGARLDQKAEALEALGATERAEVADRLDETDETIAALDERLGAVEADARTASEALKAAEEATRRAETMAAVEALGADVERRLRRGEAFDGLLAELEETAGREAPEVLAEAAENGVETSAALNADFPAVAKAALRADIAAKAEDGTLGQATAWLQSQVTIRQTDPQEGDDVEARLSRIGTALAMDDAPAALAEAEALEEAPREALGDWLDRLERRVRAETALADYLATLGAAPKG